MRKRDRDSVVKSLESTSWWESDSWEIKEFKLEDCGEAALKASRLCGWGNFAELAYLDPKARYEDDVWDEIVISSGTDSGARFDTKGLHSVAIEHYEVDNLPFSDVGHAVDAILAREASARAAILRRPAPTFRFDSQPKRMGAMRDWSGQPWSLEQVVYTIGAALDLPRKDFEEALRSARPGATKEDINYSWRCWRNGHLMWLAASGSDDERDCVWTSVMKAFYKKQCYGKDWK